MEIQDDGSGKERIGWHCEHLSEGCRHCYAERINLRLGTGLEFKPGHLYRAEHEGYNNGEAKLFLDDKMLMLPLRWKKPRMIFVCSMTDLFADFVPDEWILPVLDVIRRTSYDGGGNLGKIGRGFGQHTYQILTKRAARMMAFMKRLRFDSARGLYLSDDGKHPVILKNMWLGVSTERQQEADERIPLLLQTPAAVRFISAEPLLGPIDMHLWMLTCPAIDWVIVGGESGGGYRPMRQEWVASLIDQCQTADVPVFMKQMAGKKPIPMELLRREFPK